MTRLMIPLDGRALLAPSLRQLVRCAVLLHAALMFWPATAQAQGMGFWAGGTVDPEQFFVGALFETQAIAGVAHVRPSADGAFGGGQRTVGLGLDIIYKRGDPTGWQFYTGAGPTVQIVQFDDPLNNPRRPGDEREVTGGVVGLLGLAHHSGFFAEFKFSGTGIGPNLKLGAGFTIR